MAAPVPDPYPNLRMRTVRVLDPNDVEKGRGIYWGIEGANFKIANYDEDANDAMILFSSFSMEDHHLEAVQPQPQDAGRRRTRRRRSVRKSTRRHRHRRV